MPGRITSNKIDVSISEDVEEVLRRRASRFGTGAHVVCPKEHMEKIVYLVVCKE